MHGGGEGAGSFDLAGLRFAYPASLRMTFHTIG
jgi:hypothetical protein